MVPRRGFEPLTLSLEVSCSIQLSYRGLFCGAGGGSRTRVASLENWNNDRYTTPASSTSIPDRGHRKLDVAMSIWHHFTMELNPQGTRIDQPAAIDRRGFLLLAGGAVAAALLAGCTSDTERPDAVSPAPTEPTVEPSKAEAPLVLPPPHKGMEHSTDPQLRKLAAYERALGYGFESMPLSSGLPRDVEEARTLGASMSARLKEWGKYGIRPVVLMEPIFEIGSELADLTSLGTPGYINDMGVLDTYFQGMRWEGVTDEQMGTWVPYPNPNLAIWGDGITSPAIFRANAVGAAQCLKTHFREAHVSILLNRTTQPDGDTPGNPGSSSLVKLLDYVGDVPPDLFDSFGLQGFPWERNDRPADFLSAGAAMACAARLSANRVWLNTGSFSHRKDGATDLVIDPERRIAVLNQVLEQATFVRQSGPDVNINLLAINRADQVDWSYPTATDRDMLDAWVQRAAQAGVSVTLLSGA